ALSSQNVGELVKAVSDWLKDINEEYYKRWHPEEAATLTERLEPILREELTRLLELRKRVIATLDDADKAEVLRLFGRFRRECGPVGAAKALHLLAPNFFPLWDTKIAKGYGVAKETDYFRFMSIAKQQAANLPDELAAGLTALKALDEYNYLKFVQGAK